SPERMPKRLRLGMHIRPNTVDPLIPLTLLEAVRTMDRPDAADIEEVEYVPELLNKRLGMHERVYTAIRRYAEAVRKSQRIEIAEVLALAKLIGRRPDAVVVFEAAGSAMAQTAYRNINGLTRVLIRILPAFASRPWARRRARKIIRRYFGGTVERYGANVRLR